MELVLASWKLELVAVLKPEDPSVDELSVDVLSVDEFPADVAVVPSKVTIGNCRPARALRMSTMNLLSILVTSVLGLAVCGACSAIFSTRSVRLACRHAPPLKATATLS